MVSSPLGDFTPGPHRPARGTGALAATVRAMLVGQHLIAVGLVVIGVVRAIADGTQASAAIVAGIAVLAWHAAGSLLPSRGSRRMVVGWLIGFGLVWVAAIAVSPEFVWVAFLLWLLACHLLSGGWAVLYSIAVFAGVVAAPMIHHGTTSYANVFGPLIGGIFALGISRGYLQLLRDAAERERLVASLSNARHETELLQDELALAQRQSGAAGERARIARDLHDTVAQELSSIRLIAHAAAGSGSGSSAESEALDRIQGVAGDALVDVRRIIEALTPAELEDGALGSALERVIARQQGGAKVRLHVDEDLPQLPTEVEVALLRVAQSALANVAQHAHASRVDVSLEAAGGAVRLDVVDDGAGFSVEEWERRGAASNDGRPSFGLRLMRERLRDLGGGLDIESSPGEGCALSAHLPLGPAAAGFGSTVSTEGERA